MLPGRRFRFGEFIHTLGVRGPRWTVQRLRYEFSHPTFNISQRIATSLSSVSRGSRPRLKRKSKDDRRFGAIYRVSPGTASFDLAFFLARAESFGRERSFDRMTVIFLIDEPATELQTLFSQDQPLETLRQRTFDLLVQMTAVYPYCEAVMWLDASLLDESLAAFATVFPETFNPRIMLPSDQHASLRVTFHKDFVGFQAPSRQLSWIDSWLSVRCLNDPVVMTLRSRTIDQERNTDVPEWCRFADWLLEYGVSTVFIPDTDAPPIDELAVTPHHVCPEASWNMGLRLALYERALLNIFDSSGPGALAVYHNECPYLYFTPVRPGSTFATEEHLRRLGLLPGQQKHFFAKANQFLSWESPTFDVLRAWVTEHYRIAD